MKARKNHPPNRKKVGGAPSRKVRWRESSGQTYFDATSKTVRRVVLEIDVSDAPESIRHHFH